MPPITALPPIDESVLAKALPPALDAPLDADPFTAVVPSSIAAAIATYQSDAQALLAAATDGCDKAADTAAQKLHALKLPHELDVMTSADKQLPPQAKATVAAAKLLGDEVAIGALWSECHAKDDAAQALMAALQVTHPEQTPSLEGCIPHRCLRTHHRWLGVRTGDAGRRAGGRRHAARRRAQRGARVTALVVLTAGAASACRRVQRSDRHVDSDHAVAARALREGRLEPMPSATMSPDEFATRP